MEGLIRVTNPLLDVLEVLLEAFESGEERHGWAIMKATRRTGPTVYGILDRLEDARLVTGRWEAQHPEPNKPRRRFYTLSPDAAVAVRRLLAQRRPTTQRPPVRRQPGTVIPL